MTLVSLYPYQKSFFDRQMQPRPSKTSARQPMIDGMAVGIEVFDNILAARAQRRLEDRRGPANRWRTTPRPACRVGGAPTRSIPTPNR